MLRRAAAGAIYFVHAFGTNDTALSFDLSLSSLTGDLGPRVQGSVTGTLQVPATTKAVEAAEKDARAAAQSILDANPKGGKIETLTQGFELTIPLYRTAETRTKRPFQVTDQNMTDTVNLLVEYGGLEAKAKDNPKAFYTNDYLPQGGS